MKQDNFLLTKRAVIQEITQPHMEFRLMSIMLYIVKLLNLELHIQILSSVLLLHSPSGICLPGTELLQSSFKTEFTMGSLSLRYRRSRRRHRRFLRSSCWSLRSYPRSLQAVALSWSMRWLVAVRSSMRRHRSLHDLLNIIKHCQT